MPVFTALTAPEQPRKPPRDLFWHRRQNINNAPKRTPLRTWCPSFFPAARGLLVDLESTGHFPSDICCRRTSPCKFDPAEASWHKAWVTIILGRIRVSQIFSWHTLALPILHPSMTDNPIALTESDTNVIWRARPRVCNIPRRGWAQKPPSILIV